MIECIQNKKTIVIFQMVKINDCYAEENKCNPCWHKKSVKYAIKNGIITDGTKVKVIFKKTGAKGGYNAQKTSFNNMLKIYLDKRGLKLKNKKNSNKKNIDFETLSFKVVSK